LAPARPRAASGFPGVGATFACPCPCVGVAGAATWQRRRPEEGALYRAVQVAYARKRRWQDGTTNVVMRPEVLDERLLALVPRPRGHLVTYHGVPAPAAGLRSRVVPRCEETEEPGEERRDVLANEVAQGDELTALAAPASAPVRSACAGSSRWRESRAALPRGPSCCGACSRWTCWCARTARDHDGCSPRSRRRSRSRARGGLAEAASLARSARAAERPGGKD
jgi:hypothetical protein